MNSQSTAYGLHRLGGIVPLSWARKIDSAIVFPDGKAHIPTDCMHVDGERQPKKSTLKLAQIRYML